MEDIESDALLLKLKELESDALELSSWPDGFVLRMGRTSCSSDLLTRKAALISLRSILEWRHNTRAITTDTRNEVIELMQTIEPDSVPYLTAIYAIRAYLGDTTVVESVLNKRVDEWFSEYRRREILGWICTPDAIESLKCSLGSTSYRVPLRSAVSLAMHGQSDGVSVLASYPETGFDHSDTLMVTAALARLGNSIGIARLLLFLGRLIELSSPQLSNFISSVRRYANECEDTLDLGADDWLPSYIATIVSRCPANHA